MAKVQWAYVAVESVKDDVTERHGIAMAETPKEVILSLAEQGLYVRDIRRATPLDLQLSKLRKLRKRLSKTPLDMRLELLQRVAGREKKRKRRRRWWLIILLGVTICLLVSLGIILALIWS
jgi:hypothetical protein